MSKIDKATISGTRVMGGRTLVVSMLGTKTPAAGLPKGAFFNPMTGCILIAPETVGEDNVISPTSLAKHSTIFQTVFSFFDIGWTLGGENTWNSMRGKKESGGGRGTCGEEVLLEASVDCARGETSLYYK